MTSGPDYQQEGDGMTVTYQITLTAEQAELVRSALEACGRMGIGQLEDALTFYPTAEFRPDGWHEAMDQVQDIMQPFQSRASSKGATHCRLWSMMTSIRHRLAWDRAIAEGLVKQGEPRKWPDMLYVSYDEPDSSDWPSLTIERITPHEKPA